MNRLFIATLALVISFAISGCTKKSDVGCAIDKTVVTAMTGGIALGLQCSNPQAIHDSLDSIIKTAKLDFCSKAVAPSAVPGAMNLQSVTIPVDLCVQIGSIIIETGKSTLPQSWGCSAQFAGDVAKIGIIVACKAASIGIGSVAL
jgi:hypothetical protein